MRCMNFNGNWKIHCRADDGNNGIGATATNLEGIKEARREATSSVSALAKEGLVSVYSLTDTSVLLISNVESDMSTGLSLGVLT